MTNAEAKRAHTVIRIRQATSHADIETARALFREYAAAIDVDLGFQDFAEELAGLPGDYAGPRGALLLASDDDTTLGCVALRPLEWPAIAEMKRLYVRPAGRGRGVGRLLVERVLWNARARGYQRVRLDTLPTMTAAQRMYESLGFREIDAYCFNPIAGTRYMEWVNAEEDTR